MCSTRPRVTWFIIKKKKIYWLSINVEDCMLVRAASYPKSAPSRGFGDLHRPWEPRQDNNSKPCCNYGLLQKTCLIATEQIKAALRFHYFCITNNQSMHGNTRFILLQVFSTVLQLWNKHCLCLLCAGLRIRLRSVSAKKRILFHFSVVSVSKKQLPALGLNKLRLFQVMIQKSLIVLTLSSYHKAR